MSKWNSKRFSLLKLTPPQIIILGFFSIIIVGAFLLMLPVSLASNQFNNPVTAFFTATSATCVTGLSVVDTEQFYSDFGQAVILLLIQIGGLGFMSLAMLFNLLLKRRVSPKERVIFVQSMNLFSGEKMFPFIKSMLAFTFTFEGVGAVLLSFKFIPEFGVGEGIAKSVFHSVSAFCNAGFDILGKSNPRPFMNLELFADNVYVNVIIGTLIVCGGLGFIVWYDIYHAIKERKKLFLYTKMVLTISAILIVSGAVLFLVSEWDNPATMGNSSAGGKILRSFFLSITCRTAGFTTINIEGLTDISKVASMLLMFIGGSSGSTAGGIKTVTMGIVLISVFQIIKGNKEIDICKRRIENDVVSRAFALFSISGMTLLVCSFLLNFTEKAGGNRLLDLAFEAFSAFATVGLTASVTPELSHVGMVIIMALMFFGRVGITTIAFTVMMSLNAEKQSFSYPKANILIG
jgi:trk system potassium uptake protein TrkH